MKDSSSAKKSYIGLKKKVHGDFFEALVEFFANADKLFIIKIPEGCKVAKGKLVRVKSPFDFMLNLKEATMLFDAKTTMNKFFSYSAINQDQILNLAKMNNPSNFCGYVICFDKEVGFAPVELLARVKPKTSININDCIYLGTVKQFSFKNLCIAESKVERNSLAEC